MQNYLAMSTNNSADPPPPRPPSSGRRVTLKDLAEHLGLSVATISRALSGPPQADALAPETRQRVERAAREAKVYAAPAVRRRKIR